MQYSWPGNIRELENLIERLVIFSEKEYIEDKDFPQKIMEQQSVLSSPNLLKYSTMPEILGKIEKNMMIEALEKEKLTKSC